MCIAEQGEDCTSDSDDIPQTATRHSSPLQVVAGPVLLAATLALGLLGAAYIHWPSEVAQAVAPTVDEPQTEPISARLLESDELLKTTMKHTLSFYDEFAESDKLSDLSAEERRDLDEQLLKATREHVELFANRVAEKDAEAARQLRDFELTPEQWEKTHQVLAALHDTRTREIGEFVQKAVEEANGDREHARSLVNERLGSRAEELRSLRDELIPKELHTSGLNNWEVAVGADGVHGDGAVGDWDASFRVDNAVAAPARRLFLEGFVGLLTGTIGIVLATIFSIITTVLTIMSQKAGAHLFWMVQGAASGGLCLTALGSMKPWNHWLPCIISTLFFGVEAIWTWMKHDPPTSQSPFGLTTLPSVR